MHVPTKPRSSSPVLFLRLLSREYMLEEGDMDEDDSDDDDEKEEKAPVADAAAWAPRDDEEDEDEAQWALRPPVLGECMEQSLQM